MSTGNEKVLKSKTQQKRDADAAQALGAKLIQLSESQINELFENLELSEKLREALLACHVMSAREARRRQLQYIGKLMREVELEPVQKLLAEFRQSQSAETLTLHSIERWRERLLTEGSDALKDLLGQYHSTDANKVRKLIASAHREASQKQPPRAARLLFKYLRELMVE